MGHFGDVHCGVVIREGPHGGLETLFAPGSWTLVAKENGDAKTGMLGGIGFSSLGRVLGHKVVLLLHTRFTIDLRSE